MELRILENGKLQIDDARLTWFNFAGEKFGKGGERTFGVRINTQEDADALCEAGYNVTIKPHREEGGLPFMVLKVKIKFNEFGPNVYLESGGNMRKLDEESISMLSVNLQAQFINDNSFLFFHANIACSFTKKSGLINSKPLKLSLSHKQPE